MGYFICENKAEFPEYKPMYPPPLLLSQTCLDLTWFVLNVRLNSLKKTFVNGVMFSSWPTLSQSVSCKMNPAQNFCWLGFVWGQTSGCSRAYFYFWAQELFLQSLQGPYVTPDLRLGMTQVTGAHALYTGAPGSIPGTA